MKQELDIIRESKSSREHSKSSKAQIGRTWPWTLLYYTTGEDSFIVYKGPMKPFVPFLRRQNLRRTQWALNIAKQFTATAGAHNGIIDSQEISSLSRSCFWVSKMFLVLLSPRKWMNERYMMVLPGLGHLKRLRADWTSISTKNYQVARAGRDCQLFYAVPFLVESHQTLERIIFIQNNLDDSTGRQRTSEPRVGSLAQPSTHLTPLQ